MQPGDSIWPPILTEGDGVTDNDDGDAMDVIMNPSSWRFALEEEEEEEHEDRAFEGPHGGVRGMYGAVFPHMQATIDAGAVYCNEGEAKRRYQASYLVRLFYYYEAHVQVALRLVQDAILSHPVRPSTPPSASPLLELDFNAMAVRLQGQLAWGAELLTPQLLSVELQLLCGYVYKRAIFSSMGRFTTEPPAQAEFYIEFLRYLYVSAEAKPMLRKLERPEVLRRFWPVVQKRLRAFMQKGQTKYTAIMNVVQTVTEIVVALGLVD